MTEENNDWRETVPEQFRELRAVKNAPDIETAYKSIADSVNYANGALRMPSEEAGPEDWDKFHKKVTSHSKQLLLRPDFDNEESVNNFYTQIGRPEEPDKYEIPEFEGDVNSDKIKGFRNIAYKYGLSNDQFKGVVKEVVGGDLEIAEQAKLAEQEAMNSLKQEWGSGFENHANKAEFIRKEFFADVIPEDAPLPAGLLKAFDSIAAQMGSEGSSLTAMIPDNRGGGLTPDEALSRAAELRRTEAYKAGDPIALKKHSEYFRIAYPD